MLGRKFLLPGTSTVDQLYRILELTGKPSMEDISGIASPFAVQMISSVSIRRTKKFSEIFPNESSDVINMLTKLLEFNPQKRLSAKEALQHPYVAQYHNPHNEPQSGQVFHTLNEGSIRLSSAEYRESIYNEIIRVKK